MPIVSFRCNDEEYARIQAKAQAAGTNVSALAREALLGPETPSNLRTPDARYNSLVSRVSTIEARLATAIEQGQASLGVRKK